MLVSILKYELLNLIGMRGKDIKKDSKNTIDINNTLKCVFLNINIYNDVNSSSSPIKIVLPCDKTFEIN